MNLLILLVGSNPLPLFATAKFLIEAGNDVDEDIACPDRVLFICTKDTHKYADNLCSVLSFSAAMKKIIDLEEDGRKPDKIRKKITNEMNSLFSAQDNSENVIHLNYIGGTKPMAVQAVLALTDWIKNKPNSKFILSDVDPELDKIILSDTGYGIPIGSELKDYVKLTIEELLQLHGMKINSPGHEQLRLADEDLLRLCKIKLQDFRNNNRQVIDNKDTETFISQIKDKLGQKFLDGGWLEEFVLRSLLKLKSQSDQKIDEARANVYAQFNKRQTEIDAIAIKGYQLFLFTCVTAKKVGSVKLKAFEALYRANQLGGEHAKVIVVSTMFNDFNNNEPENSFQNVNNLKELKKDLMQFEAERNCRLIGLNELVGEIEGKNSLTNAIKHILEGGQ